VKSKGSTSRMWVSRRVSCGCGEQEKIVATRTARKRKEQRRSCEGRIWVLSSDYNELPGGPTGHITQKRDSSLLQGIK